MVFRAKSPFPTSIPGHSVDWRFLLPLDNTKKLLVIVDEQADYHYSFQYLKIPTLCKRFDQLSELSNVFDIIALPIGFRSDGKKKWTKSLEHVLQLLRPGGTILIGFSNRWSIRKKIGTKSLSSIWEMRRVLSNHGLQKIQIFGALPELVAPEFVFPLSSHSLDFVLNHRYQHKFPKTFLTLTKMYLAEIMLNLLPFYYVVAQLGEE